MKPKDVKFLIACAIADLEGSLQAFEAGDINMHDWDAHKMTLEDLIEYEEELNENIRTDRPRT